MFRCSVSALRFLANRRLPILQMCLFETRLALVGVTIGLRPILVEVFKCFFDKAFGTPLHDYLLSKLKLMISSMRPTCNHVDEVQ